MTAVLIVAAILAAAPLLALMAVTDRHQARVDEIRARHQTPPPARDEAGPAGSLNHSTEVRS